MSIRQIEKVYVIPVPATVHFTFANGILSDVYHNFHKSKQSLFINT